MRRATKERFELAGGLIVWTLTAIALFGIVARIVKNL